MIEHMKRFVNEHHTLIVVIIGVLVICFIYWWFCCKDRPLTNKVKGGGACGLYLSIVENRVDAEFIYKFNYIFHILGVNISGIPLITMSINGENFVCENNLLNKYFVITTNAMLSAEQNILNLIKQPVNYLFRTSADGTTAKQILGENIGDYLNTTVDFNESPEEWETNNTFNFESLLIFLNPDFQIILKNNYIELKNFLLNNFADFFEEASFVGQPCYINYDESRKHGDVIKNSTEIASHEIKIYSTEEGVNDDEYVWSATREGEFENSIKICYDESKENLRNWYNNGNFLKQKLKRCYDYDKLTGKITFIDKSDQNIDGKTWNVADIYPSYKLMMTIVLLLTLADSYIRKNPESEYNFFDMIASYIIYVNLLNTFSAVRMNHYWNGKIKNTYVYKILNQNGNVNRISTMEIEKSITNNELDLTLQHALDISEPEAIHRQIDKENLKRKVIGTFSYLLEYQKKYENLADLIGICKVDEYILGINFNQMDKLKIFNHQNDIKVILNSLKIHKVRIHESIETFTSIHSVDEVKLKKYHERMQNEFHIQNVRHFILYRINNNVKEMLNNTKLLTINEQDKIKARLQYIFNNNRIPIQIMVKAEIPNSPIFNLSKISKKQPGLPAVPSPSSQPDSRPRPTPKQIDEMRKIFPGIDSYIPA